MLRVSRITKINFRETLAGCSNNRLSNGPGETDAIKHTDSWSHCIYVFDYIGERVAEQKKYSETFAIVGVLSTDSLNSWGFL